MFLKSALTFHLSRPPRLGLKEGRGCVTRAPEEVCAAPPGGAVEVISGRVQQTSRLKRLNVSADARSG